MSDDRIVAEEDGEHDKGADACASAAVMTTDSGRRRRRGCFDATTSCAAAVAAATADDDKDDTSRDGSVEKSERSENAGSAISDAAEATPLGSTEFETRSPVGGAEANSKTEAESMAIVLRSTVFCTIAAPALFLNAFGVRTFAFAASRAGVVVTGGSKDLLTALSRAGAGDADHDDDDVEEARGDTEEEDAAADERGDDETDEVGAVSMPASIRSMAGGRARVDC